jgi:hypothetical protein
VVPDENILALDAGRITIDPAKIANLESVLAELDRSRVRVPEPPALPALAGPVDAIDGAIGRVASSAAGRQPTPGSAAGASSGARSGPAPRLSGAVPPGVQVLRLRVGDPDGRDKVQATVRVRVEGDNSSRLTALEAGRSVSIDVLALGLLAAGIAGVGLFGRAATREGRRILKARRL